MNGCSIRPVTHVGTTWVLSVGVPSPLWEVPEFGIKMPLGAPLLIFPLDYLLESFPQGILLQDSRGLKSEFFLSYESGQRRSNLTCQLYHWHLCPRKLFSPMTKSLDPIVVTVLQVGFPAENLSPTTGGFAINFPVPEA